MTPLDQFSATHLAIVAVDELRRGQMKKDLLEFRLRHHVVLDGELGLDALDESEQSRERVRRVALIYVYVDVAFALLAQLNGALEGAKDELDEGHHVLGALGVGCCRAGLRRRRCQLDQKREAAAVAALQVMQAAQTLELAVDHYADVGAQRFRLLHAFGTFILL